VKRIRKWIEGRLAVVNAYRRRLYRGVTLELCDDCGLLCPVDDVERIKLKNTIVPACESCRRFREFVRQIAAAGAGE
jgi:pyridoxal biosynthesis lyase PdxS